MTLFSEYFGFPRQFSFQQMFHAYLSFEAGTIGQSGADKKVTYQASPHLTKLKKKKFSKHAHRKLT
jgi:hypothetical protein